MSAIEKLNNLEYEDMVEVRQTDFSGTDDRPEVHNKIRKLLFFIRAEGILRTFAKIKSKRDKTLVPKKYNTTIKVKYKGKVYVNYSTQFSKDPDDFVVNNSFIVLVQPHIFSPLDFIKFNQFVPHELNEEKVIQLPKKKLQNLSIQLKPIDKGVFIYGLGDYSRVYIAPNIKKLKKIFCVDYVSKNSEYYKNKFGYSFNGIVPQDSYNVLEKVKKPLAIIATYHSDHTRIAQEIYQINPNTLIFIEKPPCVTQKDIIALANLYKKGANIEIGYNRRFIPLNQNIKERLKGQRAIINISVKEILIGENHWYFWDNQGTRITGNLTHWIDLCNYWLEDEIPVEISMLKSNSKDETFTTSILFSNGSLVNLTVSDKGNPLRGVQEKIEIRTEKETYFIDDYLKAYIIEENGKKRSFNKITRSKGHDEMYKHVVKLFQDKVENRFMLNDLIKTALTTFLISEMFKNDTNHIECGEAISKMINEFN